MRAVRFDVSVLSYRVHPSRRNGLIEPGSALKIDRVVVRVDCTDGWRPPLTHSHIHTLTTRAPQVCNTGYLPLPTGAAIDFGGSLGLQRSAQVELPALKPGERRVLEETFAVGVLPAVQVRGGCEWERGTALFPPWPRPHMFPADCSPLLGGPCATA